MTAHVDEVLSKLRSFRSDGLGESGLFPPVTAGVDVVGSKMTTTTTPKPGMTTSALKAKTSSTEPKISITPKP